jgi:hypothetical protein
VLGLTASPRRRNIAPLTRGELDHSRVHHTLIDRAGGLRVTLTPQWTQTIARPWRFPGTRSLYGRLCRAVHGFMRRPEAKLREPRAVSSSGAGSRPQASADNNLEPPRQCREDRAEWMRNISRIKLVRSGHDTKPTATVRSSCGNQDRKRSGRQRNESANGTDTNRAVSSCSIDETVATRDS